MAKYTVQEITEMTEHYLHLVKNNENDLEQHREELESLDYETKIDLVTKLLWQCPADELNSLVFSQDPSSSDSNSFYELLSNAKVIAEQLYNITIPYLSTAYTAFSDEEFDSDLYNQFPVLCQLISQRWAYTLAINLMIHTPLEETSLLRRNLGIAFRGSQFLEVLNEALVLNRLLYELLGDNPVSALTSRDFKLDLFHKYPDLVLARLGSHEKNIAARLIEKGVSQEIIVSCLNDNDPRSCSSLGVQQTFALIYTHYCALVNDAGVPSTSASSESNTENAGLSEESEANESSFSSSDESENGVCYSGSIADAESEQPVDDELRDLGENRRTTFARNYQRHGFLAAVDVELQEFYSYQPCSIL